ncbi:MAG TPA: DUF2723 domain-containing protein, partial [bacterium]|nr:DUF2723 domain-containing protein [bacterium]
MTAFSRWLWLALVFLTTQMVYLHTLNPAFPNDDSAETITAGVTLGLQHPPGYALAALIGRCESLLPLGSFGFRANWGASLLASLGAALLIFVVLSIFDTGWFLGEADPKNWIVPFCGVIGGFSMAFAPTYWRNALSAKGGTYLLSICLQLLILCCLVYSVRLKKDVRSKSLVFSFFLTGLGLAGHWETLIIFIPALISFFIWTRKINRTQWIVAASVLMLGASPLIYLPLRGHLNPVLNLGAPDTFAYFGADLFRNYFSYREMTLSGALFGLLKGSLSLNELLGMIQKPFENKTEALLLYLGWDIGWLSFIMALFGVAQWLRFSGKRILFFILLSWFLLWSSNFYYFNISQTPDSPYLTLKFFLSSDWMIFLLSAVAMASLLSRLNHFKKSLSLLTAVLLVCCLMWKGNNIWNGLDQSSGTVTYDYGQNLLKSLPKRSLFFAESDADYFSLYYLQQAEQRRPDVIMIPAFTLFEPWGIQSIEKRNPELGLTASSVSFPDHFARIIYASSELVEKNVNQRPIAFSNFNGAFHLYFMNRQKNIKIRSSGLVWLLDSPLIHADSCLAPNRLMTRDLEEISSQRDGSLDGIHKAYDLSGS